MVVALLVLAGCVNEGYMGDNPAIHPNHHSGEVTVEMEEGNMVCVTENNDATSRTCVPVVHDVEDDS